MLFRSQTTYGKYRELAYLRKPLKTSFTLTLSLVLLLSLFAAVWAAFYSARRMVAPLQNLSQGTRAVADGDYETRLPSSSEDEVGFLVESFNDMTRRLAKARDETRRSQQQVEDQRRYLEAVLSQLSTGVLTLDESGICQRARLVYLNAADCPVDARRAAELLAGEKPNAALFAAAAEVAVEKIGRAHV